MLASAWSTLISSPRSSCDPRRPRRAGAGRGCWWHLDRHVSVAILADPGGPVLAADRRGHPPGLHPVAILADPGGPVLAMAGQGQLATAGSVAILADPGGPVLAPTCPARSSAQGTGCDPRRPRRAGAGPTSGTRRQTPRRCDPRRPRRAGAWQDTSWSAGVSSRSLRSSPTPEGRCWSPRSPRSKSPASSLRSSPTPEGRCWLPTDPHRLRLRRRCDPRRPRRAGAGSRSPCAAPSSA